MRQPGWEGSLGEKGHLYVHGWVLSPFIWNYRNIVNWLYSNSKKKRASAWRKRMSSEPVWARRSLGYKVLGVCGLGVSEEGEAKRLERGWRAQPAALTPSQCHGSGGRALYPIQGVVRIAVLLWSISPLGVPGRRGWRWSIQRWSERTLSSYPGKGWLGPKVNWWWSWSLEGRFHKGLGSTFNRRKWQVGRERGLGSFVWFSFGT